MCAIYYSYERSTLCPPGHYSLRGELSSAFGSTYFNESAWTYRPITISESSLERDQLDDFLMATPTGLEPVLSDVTDRCFSQLNYGARYKLGTVGVSCFNSD